MKKIALITGHNEVSQGVYGNVGISEYTFNKDLIMEIRSMLSVPTKAYKRNPLVGYSKQMRQLHKELDADNTDVAIEFHFNGCSNPSVNGHETLYCSKSGKVLASIMNKHMDVHLPNNGRNIKKRSKDDRGGKFLCKGKSVCILTEPFFASHQHLYIKGGKYREALVTMYVDAINEIGRSL